MQENIANVIDTKYFHLENVAVSVRILGADGIVCLFIESRIIHQTGTVHQVVKVAVVGPVVQD